MRFLRADMRRVARFGGVYVMFTSNSHTRVPHKRRAVCDPTAICHKWHVDSFLRRYFHTVTDLPSCFCNRHATKCVASPAVSTCNLDSYNIINVLGTYQHVKVDCNMQSNVSNTLLKCATQQEYMQQQLQPLPHTK